MSLDTTTTKPQPHDILNVRRLPGRLTPEQTATLLGFAPHDIPVLVKAKLLRPLGKPLRNACKWFPANEVENLRGSTKWLEAAVKAVSEGRRGGKATGPKST